MRRQFSDILNALTKSLYLLLVTQIGGPLHEFFHIVQCFIQPFWGAGFQQVRDVLGRIAFRPDKQGQQLEAKEEFCKVKQNELM